MDEKFIQLSVEEQIKIIEGLNEIQDKLKSILNRLEIAIPLKKIELKRYDGVVSLSNEDLEDVDPRDSLYTKVREIVEEHGY